MADICALCEQPMNPGQTRADTEDGRKAHSSCVALTDQKTGVFDALKEIVRIEQAVTEHADARLDQMLTNPGVFAGIADAVRDAIPSKATLLRRMMDQSATALAKRLDEKRSYGHELEQGDVIAMTKAMTILRTVAIYVMDDE